MALTPEELETHEAAEMVDEGRFVSLEQVGVVRHLRSFIEAHCMWQAAIANNRGEKAHRRRANIEARRILKFVLGRKSDPSEVDYINGMITSEQMADGESYDQITEKTRKKGDNNETNQT